MAIRWVPSELHTHTFHSDGRQTLTELVHAAKSLGFECIALTDHNTMTGLKGKEKVEEETGMRIVQGMEWTTFYGHMVTIGVKDYVDWRRYSSSELQKGIKLVHDQGAVVGMAHPYRVGSPICTGCFWEFDVKDFNMIDYVEVWSSLFAPIRHDNHRAFAFWTDLLNSGYHISATSGRDWHSPEAVSDPISTTFVGISTEDGEITENQVIEAIKNGRLSVSIGPLLFLEIEKDGRSYGIGEKVPLDEQNHLIRFSVGLDWKFKRQDVSIAEQDLMVSICSNLGVIAELVINPEVESSAGVLHSENLTWLRAELYGCVNGIKTMLAFTNPIYITK